jgi:hypothetical protein
LARLLTETRAQAFGFNRRAVLICAAALVAPVLMAVIIHRYGVNVPYWDEWDQLAVVSSAYDHSLSAGLLWEQQNEHRPVVSKLISIVMARTTDLNLVAEMYVGFAFQLVSLILIWRMLAVGFRDRARVLIGPLTIAASLLLFWAVAHEDWIWGLASVQYFLSIFWAVLSVWALARWPGRWLSVCIVSVATTLAMFTTGCGFALIGVGTLGILGYGIEQKKIRWLQLVSFALVSAGWTALYLKDYTSPGYSATSLARLHPLQMASYFVTYVGSPFWIRTGGYRVAQLFGLLGIISLAAAGYYIIRHARGWILAAAPWLLLAFYALINAAETAFARIDFGVEQATSSRYRPIASLFWISLVMISSMVAYQIRPRFSRRVVVAASAAVIIAFMGGYWFLYYRGVGALKRHSEYVAAGVRHIMDYSHASDDDLRMYHPTPSTVRELSRKLDQYHLGPFASRRVGGGSVR